MNEELIKQVQESAERLSLVRRYERINNRIDEIMMKKGILPQFIIHGGEYATLYLHPEFESKWKGTFFDKERLFLSTTLAKANSVGKLNYFLEKGKSRPFQRWFVGYCDKAFGTPEGARIHLCDPTGEVILPPFQGMCDLMEIYVGKILFVKVSFGPFEAKTLEVGTLPFTLTERITEDSPLYDTLTEPPFSGRLE